MLGMTSVSCARRRRDAGRLGARRPTPLACFDAYAPIPGTHPRPLSHEPLDRGRSLTRQKRQLAQCQARALLAARRRRRQRRLDQPKAHSPVGATRPSPSTGPLRPPLTRSALSIPLALLPSYLRSCRPSLSPRQPGHPPLYSRVTARARHPISLPLSASRCAPHLLPSFLFPFGSRTPSPIFGPRRRDSSTDERSALAPRRLTPPALAASQPSESSPPVPDRTFALLPPFLRHAPAVVLCMRTCILCTD